MKRNAILLSLGVLGIILIALYGGVGESALWGLLILPFFFIGEPWYKSLKKKHRG